MEYTWSDLAKLAEEYTFGDIAKLAEDYEALPAIIAAICRAHQGQSGGGGVALTTDKPLVKGAGRAPKEE